MGAMSENGPLRLRGPLGSGAYLPYACLMGFNPRHTRRLRDERIRIWQILLRIRGVLHDFLPNGQLG